MGNSSPAPQLEAVFASFGPLVHDFLPCSPLCSGHVAAKAPAKTATAAKGKAEPIAVWEGRQPRFLVELGVAERWQAQSALTRRQVSPRLKAYLGRSA